MNFAVSCQDLEQLGDPGVVHLRDLSKSSFLSVKSIILYEIHRFHDEIHHFHYEIHHCRYEIHHIYYKSMIFITNLVDEPEEDVVDRTPVRKHSFSVKF